MSSMSNDHGVLLRADNLKKHFPVSTNWLAQLRGQQKTVKAVDGVTLDIHAGQTLAVVGESGSGKSTLGRLLLRLIAPTDGRIWYKGRDVTAMERTELHDFRRHAQIIFQDPYASLNPRMKVGTIIREPLDIYGEGTPAERRRRVHDLLERVGLTSAYADAYPSELSGGQRQRIGIAAALALAPEIIIADEPTSSLDVSVQAQTLNLLAELQRDYNLTFVLITHDLGVVHHFADRVAVMYLGKIVETAPTETLFAGPQHPYTQTLLSAIPNPDPQQRVDWHIPEGEPPSPVKPPPGCAFHPRCPKVMAVCSVQHPVLQPTSADHSVACWLHHEPEQVSTTENSEANTQNTF